MFWPKGAGFVDGAVSGVDVDGVGECFEDVDEAEVEVDWTGRVEVVVVERNSTGAS